MVGTYTVLLWRSCFDLEGIMLFCIVGQDDILFVGLIERPFESE